MIIDQLLHRKKTLKHPAKQGEPRLRSFVKALSWRVFGTLDTVLVSWWIAGDFTVAFSIGSFELITKTVLYFFHERLWVHIKWGNN